MTGLSTWAGHAKTELTGVEFFPSAKQMTCDSSLGAANGVVHECTKDGSLEHSKHQAKKAWK